MGVLILVCVDIFGITSAPAVGEEPCVLKNDVEVFILVCVYTLMISVSCCGTALRMGMTRLLAGTIICLGLVFPLLGLAIWFKSAFCLHSFNLASGRNGLALCFSIDLASAYWLCSWYGLMFMWPCISIGRVLHFYYARFVYCLAIAWPEHCFKLLHFIMPVLLLLCQGPWPAQCYCLNM